MPELLFKGKEFVYNHHLAVPFRPLLPEPTKSIGDARLDGNLIVHGDNLHALKALLPMYAGKVDCIFIDPPYNTGNESWSYNDNVNAPMIKKWLEDNPVTVEDGLRHDKWLTMMWPRLRLLHELLDDHGVIFVTIDDNEVDHLKTIMAEIFGQDNFVTTFIWRKVDSPNDNKVPITPDHDYVVCYARDKSAARFSRMVAPSILDAYPNKTGDGRLYRDRLLKKNGRNSLRRDRPTMFFPLDDPDGDKVVPIHDNGEEACWSMGKNGIARHKEAGTLIWKKIQKLGREVWEPYTREFAPEDDPTRPYPTIWNDVGTMRQAKALLRNIFGTADLFDTPKPVDLMERILHLVDQPNAIILDSFAGSGTTAHAVLEANKRDSGNRKFILVEMEDYADSLTAERMRRVINGYAFEGIQREGLLREKLTWSKFQKPDELLKKVQSFDVIDSPRFDRIKKEIKDGELIVTGEKMVAAQTEGLGGSFTYCELGEPIELDKLLTGETLPSFEALGAVLFHMATNQAFDASALDLPALGVEGLGYLGDAPGFHVWLLYQPDMDFLKSPKAALTMAMAKAMHEAKPDKRHLVFAPARFVSQKLLNEAAIPVEFAPLPYGLYRMEMVG